jgi:hypothetical protein
MALGPFDRVTERWQALPSETRFASGVLGVCGLAALVLSAWFIQTNITGPFRVPTATLIATRSTFQSTSEARAAEAQKLLDTDHDGLSDYAELNIYHTSPYLADTDSDGVPDAIEIAQGTDPNCPKGQNCGGIANADLQPSLSASSSYQSLLDTNQVPRAVEPGQTAGTPTASQQFILNAPDPSTVTATQARDLLAASGLTAAGQLANLTDVDVLRVYKATYDQILPIRAKLNNPETIATTSTQ